jgi:RNA-directed DNA polymerase
VSTSVERNAPRHQITDAESVTWNKLPWRKLEQHVYKLQKRIYRASQHGNVRKVQKLQKLLMKSKAARLVALRRVTQDNQGKRTAGIDGVKSVKPKDRFTMTEHLHPKHWKRTKAKPVRRVWIPKPGKAERRPLGIPVMLDRSRQALAKMALEPEWEARFEPNSYGFRPGRSCQDAIDAIFLAIRYKPKFVFDADIQGCFDNIDHNALLEKLRAQPILRRAIKCWLKAGVLEGVDFTPSERGTPQGGVISPLLANCALHGLEAAIVKDCSSAEEKPVLIRYADDFVILHSDRHQLQRAADSVVQDLADMGLVLSAKKTRVTHTLTPYEGKVGVDFLGFTIRQFPVGKTHTGKNPHGKPLGFKTIIKPSKEGIKRHLAETNQRIRRLRSAPQAALIKELNPLVQGWANYYSAVVSARVFNGCDRALYFQLRSWIRFRHPNKGKHWRMQRYWRRKGNDQRVFATPEGVELAAHRRTHIQRHIKVRGEASPYDGNLLYWVKRLREHPLMYGEKAKLLKLQQGMCPRCGLYFRDGELTQVDHAIPIALGGKDDISNKRVYHNHCHDEKTAEDMAYIAKRKAAGINNNDHTLRSRVK